MSFTAGSLGKPVEISLARVRAASRPKHDDLVACTGSRSHFGLETKRGDRRNNPMYHLLIMCWTALPILQPRAIVGFILTVVRPPVLFVKQRR